MSREIRCQFIAGGTGEVCKWINDRGIAEFVVSIVQHKDHQYLVFYRSARMQYNTTD